MPGGTRGAPTVDGSETFKQVSIKYIDYTGEKRSDSYRVEAATTEAAIEAVVATTQLTTNASIYEVIVADVYTSTPSSSNALEEVYENAQDNVVIQFKHSTLASARFYIPSPIEAIFTDGTPNVDPNNSAFLDVVGAFDSIIAVGYAAVGVRFTERRQMNQQINI